MPKIRPKSQLPQKFCPVCNLPFTWRKAWAKDWATVKYCSDGCRRAWRQKSKAAERNRENPGYPGDTGGNDR